MQTPTPDIPQLFENSPLSRFAELLNELASGILDFCEQYLFCVVAMGLWVKIILGVCTGRRPSFFMVMIAIICSIIAVTMGAVFWGKNTFG